jgi:hypothetical protein
MNAEILKKMLEGKEDMDIKVLVVFPDGDSCTAEPNGIQVCGGSEVALLMVFTPGVE